VRGGGDDQQPRLRPKVSRAGSKLTK
jgi:hypothetical protein